MKNLSLQMTQATPLKKAADTVSKSNVNVDKAESAEKNTPFQMILSKQVQAQQAPEKQGTAQSAPANTVTAKTATTKLGHPEPTAAGLKSKDKVNNAQQSVTVANAIIGDDNQESDNGKNLISNLSTTPVEQVKLDSKALLSEKEDADTKPENIAINVVDSNQAVLVASTLMPVINTIPQVNMQNSAVLSEANTDGKTMPVSEGPTPRQQSLDAVLSNALSQNKSTNVPESDTLDTKTLADSKPSSDQTRWLDAVLPNASKPVVGDESSTARLLPNSIKDIVNKDMVTKDIVVPASFQPTVQVNAAVATQHLESTNSISAYPGKTGWDQAISQKVVWMVGAGEQSATLTLNPPDLGPLQVVIHVHNDKADATFISDNAEVRQALQDGMSNLRDKMSESGIALGQANVNSGEQSQQQFQATMQQRDSVSQRNNAISTLPVEKATTASNTLVRVSNGLVDTFA